MFKVRNEKEKTKTITQLLNHNMWLVHFMTRIWIVYFIRLFIVHYSSMRNVKYITTNNNNKKQSLRNTHERTMKKSTNNNNTKQQPAANCLLNSNKGRIRRRKRSGKKRYNDLKLWYWIETVYSYGETVQRHIHGRYTKTWWIIFDK